MTTTTPGSGEEEKDEKSLLQKGLGLGGLAASAYGLGKTAFGKDPTEGFAKSIDSRRKLALMGRLGPAPEEIQQKKDDAFRFGINMAEQGGADAQRALLAEGGGGIPSPLSERAANIQEKYIAAGGEQASKMAADVDKTAALQRNAELQSLSDDEKYLAALRANKDETKQNLLLRGGKLLFGMSGYANASDALGAVGGLLGNKGKEIT